MKVKTKLKIGDYVSITIRKQEYIVKIFYIGEHPNFRLPAGKESHLKLDFFDFNFCGTWANVAESNDSSNFWIKLDELCPLTRNKIMMHLLEN